MTALTAHGDLADLADLADRIDWADPRQSPAAVRGIPREVAENRRLLTHLADAVPEQPGLHARGEQHLVMSRLLLAEPPPAAGACIRTSSGAASAT